MMRKFLALLFLVSHSLAMGDGLPQLAEPASPSPTAFKLSDYGPIADGLSDDTPALQRCFAAVARAGGGSVLIGPGTYRVNGNTSVMLASKTKVTANGAKFLLPEKLGDRARLILFKGENISDFSWTGGSFTGHCFDAQRTDNAWEPNVHTQIFFITTTHGGTTARIRFQDVTSNGIAGAVVAVFGLPKAGSESEVDTLASDITVENCTLLDSGRFCWDYGYLWETLVWPEDYSPLRRGHAEKYFPKTLIHEGVRFEPAGNRVLFDNSQRPIPVSASPQATQMVCFLAERLPSSLKRGKAYYVVASSPDSIKISEGLNGPPIRFPEAPSGEARIMHNMLESYWNLMTPTGCGDTVGGVDLRCCQRTRIAGCTLSAWGDTTHIQRCYDNTFTGNQVTGSRMGAVFLAEFCKRSEITNNIVEGTNGSRTMSVEKSNEDVKVIGNTFRGGGRGNWINQPKNILIEKNSFIKNTTKGKKDHKLGRRIYTTGDYDSFSELYFTVYETNGVYSGVVVRNNVFETDTEAQHAIGFQRNGRNIEVTYNTFRGPKRDVVIDPSCQVVIMYENKGLRK